MVNDKLGDSPLFLVDVQVGTGNKILVELDGDQGIGIDDCVAVSRHIEGNLDRETEDFELSVTSAGLGKPLKVQRQFLKNIGRQVIVKKNDGTLVEGVLKEATENLIISLPASKKKKLPERDVQLAPSEFTEVKVKIVF